MGESKDILKIEESEKVNTEIINPENKKEIEKIKKELQDEFDLDSIEETIKKNEIEFEHKGITYKVRKPTYKEKQDIYREKSKKYVEFLQDGDFKLEKNLKKIYKNQDIDIDAMAAKINALESKKKNYMDKLGEFLAKKAQDKDLEAYRDEIKKIEQEQYELSLEKTNYLQFSIETQLMVFTYTYITYLVTEKLIKGKESDTEDTEPDKWIKAWESFDKFLEDEELINKASFNTSLIVGVV